MRRSASGCQPETRPFLAAALRTAMKATGAECADVAYWCKVGERTIRRWVREDSPIDVEVIMRSRRLWPLFLQQLAEARALDGNQPAAACGDEATS